MADGTLKVGTITTSSGSGTITLGQSGETVTVPSGATTTLTDGISGDLKFNSGFGSVTTAYGVRAWVKFDAIGTLTVNGSGNVSSVTDTSAGTYEVNFTNNMPDTNYVTLVNPGPVISTGAKQFYFTSSSQPDAVGSTNIASRSVDVDDNGFAVADNDYVSFIAIR